MPLLRYLLARLAFIGPQLLGIVAVSFFLLKLIPGDPAPMMLGPLATQEAVDKLRHEMALDRPLPQQFALYLGRLAQGDLGRSWQTTRPVLDDLLQRFPATLELVTGGLALALLIGIPAGLLAASRPGPARELADLYGLGSAAVPDFWLALILIYLFYTLLGWAPPPMGRLDFAFLPPPTRTGLLTVDSLLAGDLVAFRAALGQLALPVLTLGLVNAGPVLKMTRSTVERLLETDFARYARASGLTGRRVVWRAFRNALPAILTQLGSLYGYLLGGAVLVEVVFAWGGAGQYAVGAVLNADINAALGFILAAAVISLLVHLLVDLACFAVDPRIRPH